MKFLFGILALLVLLQSQDSIAKPRPIFVDTKYHINNMGPASGSRICGTGYGTGFIYNKNIQGYQVPYGYWNNFKYASNWGYRRG